MIMMMLLLLLHSSSNKSNKIRKEFRLDLMEALKG